MVVKQVMLIGSGTNSIETTEAYDLSGEFDLDELCGRMTFKLPYLLPGQKNVTEDSIDLTRLKKYDTVQLYYDEFPKQLDDGTVIQAPSVPRPADLQRIFYGYIRSIRLSKAKDNITYEIEALGTLGLGEERPLTFERKEGELLNVIAGTPSGTSLNNADIGVLQLAFGDQTSDLIPAVQFRDVDANALFIKVESAKSLKEVLSAIRERYAVIIHQVGEGTMYVMTPFYLLNAGSDESLNFNAWDFRLGLNVFDCDYGDITNNVNSVVVLGFYPHFGMAIDPIMVQLNAGSGNPVTQKNYNYMIFENRDLTSDEDCQKVARQKLLEISRNFTISFRTKFLPTMFVGQPFTFTDFDRFTESSVWVIKKIAWNITKDDVSATITGYASSLDVCPEDIVIENTGIADVDQLEIRQKLEADAANWIGRFDA